MSAWRDVLSGVRTLASAALYATLIVTFGFQVTRVDGLSMAPTLQDQDRLIVNRLVYQLGEPRRGDIVVLYYPRNPEMLFAATSARNNSRHTWSVNVRRPWFRMPG
jgi:signal peptidase I